ncbi:MAG: nucleotidyltransferase domain-containing protein [Bacteroidales bacterium]|nr:nucleotidyltransferase domain-containing protein [Bacteroidales bacterium]MCM1146588.1 nucleotidyltransferase domain-containing protein [Bacteroidales bacterium]MCM1205980.1 nucleotidyltransferase domain-containing protein [Bacillota bacterium]MCM1510139.1 nucleotidyltransferase domain-containing protein [Clostridium sp.]
MKMNTGLSEQHINVLKTACLRHPEIEAAILFGSRAKGCYKKGSDIDLAIKGTGITHNTVLLLKSELEDSMLPFFVDVLHYESISSPALREHIDRVGIRL